ncbi:MULTISPECIES: RDD family protein [Alteromonas]|uniref:RDD family protein n=1 Tax=Alteromonas TaxID=226 RepID=UPI000286FBDC|nr:RDD family protein [Alteromonas macleodii]AFT96596.1 RDD domain-containing protein [Alteromonas macleodii str. 'Balearic Sea AD45']PTT92890.1 RDD family protein [Pseudomonas sp. HMWF031]
MARHDKKVKKRQSAPKSSTTAEYENASSADSESETLERAGFIRRLLAMVYDTLVATAVGMCAAMVMIVTLVVMLKNGALDLQGYAEPADLIQASFGYKLLIQTWVGLWIAGFFLWFWRRGGQTLGMRAWRLRIYSTVEEPMTWPRLFIRLFASLGGLGTLLVLFDFKNKQSLQDRLAKTEVLKLSKEANDHKSW